MAPSVPMSVKERKSLKLISFRIKHHDELMVDKLRKKTGLSQSDIIRSCLVVHLPKMMEQYDVS